MSVIVGVGIAALDIVNVTDGFPDEDAEVRALSQEIRCGGNVTNTLTVLSQFGHQCQWAGTLADDHNSAVIRQHLDMTHIDYKRCRTVNGAKSPTSYITLNQHNGSRTIVHYRDLPEYSFTDFSQHAFERVDWIHFEGRNIRELVKMLQWLDKTHPTIPISIEIEKPREGIEELFSYGDIVFFSRHFATSLGYSQAEAFLQHYRTKTSAATLVCPWGADGAYALHMDQQLLHAEAMEISPVVDTIGAGDTFNAGFIHATLEHKTPTECLALANRLAGKKCSQAGFADITKGLHGET
ncbi:PfkB family carbohydrate kinase [Kaarinaea lacus]